MKNFIKMAKNNKCKLKAGKIRVLAKQDYTPVNVIVLPTGTLPIYHTPYQCFDRKNAIAVGALLQRIRNKKPIKKSIKDVN